ncbi:Uncharacterised protein [Candidatus Tiddalikarchaeum anstoanum]|nr:Uncharacterised protein [Candidatus Tiddalikarchaeum anstoanum]
MDIASLVVQLKIMRRERPKEFEDYMNKLKISNPEMYYKIRVHFEDMPSSEEEPLILTIPKEKQKTPSWFFPLLFLIILVTLSFIIYNYASTIIPSLLVPALNNSVLPLSMTASCIPPNQVILSVQNNGGAEYTISNLELVLDTTVIASKAFTAPNNIIGVGGAVISNTMGAALVSTESYTIMITTSAGVVSAICVVE